MKESRIIIIACIFLIILILVIITMPLFCIPVSQYLINLANNLLGGVIVSLVTASCQFFVQRREITNKIFKLYFDLYKNYYYMKKTPFLYHYDVCRFYKKPPEILSKINETLDTYHGLIKKKDALYKKMDPKIIIGDEYKLKNILKLYFWFNKKAFNRTIVPYMTHIEIILKNINADRFENEKRITDNWFKYFYE